jgi:predicted aspartyl protease
MSCFKYPVEVADARGENFIEEMAWVDTGAFFSRFPASMLERLGYQPNAVRRLRMADGTSVDAPIGPVLIRLNGEAQPMLCVFGESDDVLLGATTLELFTLGVDPVQETLVPVEGLRLTMLPADDVT